MKADEDRPLKIVEAALRVVRAIGVERLTHRAIAAEADIPLGSTTDHFATRDDILAATLTHARAANRRALDEWAGTFPADVDLACELTDLVINQAEGDRGTAVVEYELYLAALRRPLLQPLSLEWSEAMTNVLKRYVDGETADALSALYDGLLLRVLVSGRRLHRDDVERVFRRVASQRIAPLSR